MIMTLGFAIALAAAPGAVSNSAQGAACRVVDGDTLRCGADRVRLLGIDAPEKGACQPGRRCAPGDPIASEESLRRAAQGSLTITRVGQDRYGRTLALVRGRYGDLSCHQLKSGHAIYRRDWDNSGRLAAICSAVR